MTVQQFGRGSCYFCSEDCAEVLETHHIVPRRFGGSDEDENLVDVCPSCHSKLEELYGRRFYEVLEVFRRETKTVDGIRIPDDSAHFYVNYDREGYREFTCKHCASQDSGEIEETPGSAIDVRATQGRQPSPAFFDQDDAIEHLREEHGGDPREAQGYVEERVGL